MRHVGRAGMTLVEVMVATTIAALASISFMGTVVFCLQQNADNRSHLNAVLIATEQQGLLRAADPLKVGNTNLTTSDFENRFNFTDESPLTVGVGAPGPVEAEPYEVFFEFAGWGTAESSTRNTLKATLPSNQAAWTNDEWVGGYVTILQGRGKGQMMRIIGNTSDTLTVSSDLANGTDTSSTGWDILPDTTSRFSINNSRTVRVNVRWGDGETYRSIVRTVLLRQD